MVASKLSFIMLGSVGLLFYKFFDSIQLLVKEMLNVFCMKYMKISNYHQMWRAQDLVGDWYLGGQAWMEH